MLKDNVLGVRPVFIDVIHAEWNYQRIDWQKHSCNMGKRTLWHVRPTKNNSARASAQSDQSLRCPHEDFLHPLLSKMTILIRLHRCTRWSELWVKYLNLKERQIVVCFVWLVRWLWNTAQSSLHLYCSRDIFVAPPAKWSWFMSYVCSLVLACNRI